MLTLGFSRKSVRLIVFGSSSQIWAELHEKAFRLLGGCTRVVVLDNLREGVITPDICASITAPYLCPAVSPTQIEKAELKGRRPWADRRIHGTTKRQVAVLFAEERPALQPLPVEPLRYYRYGERTVHLDGCVEVEAAYYSAPPG